jgi:NAD(P)-dependent dehydrogenase (short-subunit alcohol dehydrogenase family)
VTSAFATATRAFGGVDLVVNNAGLSISKSLLETTERDWDLQHDVMAKGSFLVSRQAARIMIEQGTGGDIVYIVSKNAVFAGPDNVAYGAAKADQAHQVRLLAAELGTHGIRVNGVNPDGVVRGSGIFAGGWGAQRAAVYGVPESELGAFYAKRTVLGREVLPEHVAAAVFALAGGDLSQTTGLLIPVDSGVPAAFLR